MRRGYCRRANLSVKSCIKDKIVRITVEIRAWVLNDFMILMQLADRYACMHVGNGIIATNSRPLPAALRSLKTRIDLYSAIKSMCTLIISKTSRSYDYHREKRHYLEELKYWRIPKTKRTKKWLILVKIFMV